MNIDRQPRMNVGEGGRLPLTFESHAAAVAFVADHCEGDAADYEYNLTRPTAHGGRWQAWRLSKPMPDPKERADGVGCDEAESSTAQAIASRLRERQNELNRARRKLANPDERDVSASAVGDLIDVVDDLATSVAEIEVSLIRMAKVNSRQDVVHEAGDGALEITQFDSEPTDVRAIVEALLIAGVPSIELNKIAEAHGLPDEAVYRIAEEHGLSREAIDGDADLRAMVRLPPDAKAPCPGAPLMQWVQIVRSFGLCR